MAGDVLGGSVFEHAGKEYVGLSRAAPRSPAASAVTACGCSRLHGTIAVAPCSLIGLQQLPVGGGRMPPSCQNHGRRTLRGGGARRRLLFAMGRRSGWLAWRSEAHLRCHTRLGSSTSTRRPNDMPIWLVLFSLHRQGLIDDVKSMPATQWNLSHSRLSKPSGLPMPPRIGECAASWLLNIAGYARWWLCVLYECWSCSCFARLVLFGCGGAVFSMHCRVWTCRSLMCVWLCLSQHSKSMHGQQFGLLVVHGQTHLQCV